MANSIGSVGTTGQAQSIDQSQQADPRNVRAAQNDAYRAPGDSVRLHSGSAPNEAITLPLLPSDGVVAAACDGKDSLKATLGNGMAAVAILAGALVITGGVGIPFTFELNNSRGQARLKNQREAIEHDLCEYYRKAADCTVPWIREHEKRYADSQIIEQLSAEMDHRWNTYRQATAELAAVDHAAPGARQAAMQKVQAAVEAMRNLEMPIGPSEPHGLGNRHEPNERPDQQLPNGHAADEGRAHNNAPAREFSVNAFAAPRNALGPDASYATMLLYRDALVKLKQQGFGDGDVMRLAEQQCVLHLEQLVHGFAHNYATIRGGGRAASRMPEFRTKLVRLHDQASARFIAGHIS